MNLLKIVIFSLFCITSLMASPRVFNFNYARANQLRAELNLEGNWRFEIGDKLAYASPEFDDSKWETIKVPGRWEDQGFPGYDGYAWYRINFTLKENLQNKQLFLKLGRIDDVDRVYLNGHMINGKGRWIPDFRSAYDTERFYFLPLVYLEFGKPNILAVQVYDEMGEGGIVDGEVGIYSAYNPPKFVIDLTGYWKFKTGDDLSWRHKEYADSDWSKIVVPIQWEFQGYEDYDGYAWYRRTFFINDEAEGKTLILAVGKIDDMDEVYFNGRRIGGTGRFPGERANINNEYCLQERFYTIPANLVQWNGENTIAIRVYDIWFDGGIYEAPVGIMTRDEYLKYNREREFDFFDFLDRIFSNDNRD